MKNLFSCFVAIACALFVGVSCTHTEESHEPKAPVITVTNVPDVNFAPESGEFTLNYTIENPVQGEELEVSTESTWLAIGDVTADSVTFTYEPNPSEPGSEPREAVIVLAYEGAESVPLHLQLQPSLLSRALAPTIGRRLRRATWKVPCRIPLGCTIKSTPRFL